MPKSSTALRLTAGELIRKKRIGLGLSLADLAKQVGVTRQALWAVEKGIVGPSAPNAADRAISLLGIDLMEPRND